MNLLHTETLRLEKPNRDLPRYAILSHCWGDDEVLFDDLRNGATEATRQKQGFPKVQRSCNQARADGFEYIWIDTCCVDKSSSAELAEAINSMYHWYERSEICYAYLSDMPSVMQPVLESFSSASLFERCRWFRRGWTLQELIAPRKVFFFDQDWEPIGSKDSLKAVISDITRIPESILDHEDSVLSVSVANRMSWAAGRETTRIEDRAYSLLGLFNINMPLLYGEESKAFRRLQEEIIKSTYDLSILVWEMPPSTKPEISEQFACRLLAESPDDFARGDCCPYPLKGSSIRQEYVISHLGMKLKAKLFSRHDVDSDGDVEEQFILPLGMRGGIINRMDIVGVSLRLCSDSTFVRVNPWSLIEIQKTDGSLGKDWFPAGFEERYFLLDLPPRGFGNARIAQMSKLLTHVARSKLLGQHW